MCTQPVVGNIIGHMSSVLQPGLLSYLGLLVRFGLAIHVVAVVLMILFLTQDGFLSLVGGRLLPPEDPLLGTFPNFGKNFIRAHSILSRQLITGYVSYLARRYIISYSLN